MKKELKLNLITSILYLLVISTYEILYCNCGWARGITNTYNFSIFRIVMYIIFYLIYFIFKNKFIDSVIESFESKTKKICTGTFIAISTIILCFFIINMIIWKTILLWQVITVITILLFDLFLIYITNDLLKNSILISITLGIIFSISITVNNQLDEKKHFLSTYSLALGNLSSKNHTVDTSIADIERSLTIEGFNKYFSQKPQNQLTKEYISEDIKDTPATYYFISYIPAAVGIFLAKNLGGSIADIYFAGRIFNVFGYAALIYLVLKILPYKKKIFYAVAFMPMLLCLAGIYSPDGIVYGVASIFVAYCLKLYHQQENISIKQILILCLIFILMSIIKGTAYILIGLIVFILPIIKIIKNNKKNILYFIIVFLLMLATLGVLFSTTYSSQVNDNGDPRSEGTNSRVQLEYIMENPIEYAKVLWNHTLFCFGNMKCLAFINAPMFFGKTYYNTSILLIVFILIVGLIDNSKSLNLKTRLILILTFFAVFGMTSTALYLTYTKVGAAGITGYQMRYLFPIIPLFLMCLSNKKLIYKDEKEETLLVITYIMSFFIIISIIGIILKMI